MRLRPLLAAFCLLLSLSAGPATIASAQEQPSSPALSDLEKALAEQGGVPLGTTPSDDTPIPSILDPSAPVAPPAGTAPAPAAGTAAPVPPAYLVPGQSAAVQPIAGVANLTEPDLPLEPVRIAALIAALLAVVLVGTATLLRGLGVRTSIAPAIVVAPTGPLTRVRERTGSFADDIRDFLRHAR